MNKTQKQILKEIEKYWKKHPELRFGQVIRNIGINEIYTIALDGETILTYVKDCFNTPDEEMLKRIKEKK